MEDFFDRLDKYMNVNNLNDNQMTRKAGLSIGSLGKQRKGSRGLSNESIAKILLAYSDLSAEWLLTGKGEKGKRGKGEKFSCVQINSFSPFNLFPFLILRRISARARDGGSFGFVGIVGDFDFDLAETAVASVVGRRVGHDILRAELA